MLVLQRTRARWRAVVALRAWTIAAAAGAALTGTAVLIDRVADPEPWNLVLFWSGAAIAFAASAAWLMRPAARRPADARIARYIEERCPELEDTLATAVEQLQRPSASPAAAALVADALRRIRAIDPDRIVAASALRGSALRAAAATAVFAVAVFLSHGSFSRAVHAFTAFAVPARFNVDVWPGDVKLIAGSSLRIVAGVMPAGTTIEPTLRIHGDAAWRDVAMERHGDRFAAVLTDLQQGFGYDVVVGSAVSARYDVRVLHRPRIERIDVRYDYPAALGIEPRVEEDGGDIYGPAGTRVRLTVRTNVPIAAGGLTLDDGGAVPLAVTDGGATAVMTFRATVRTVSK
jgi:hypothetical protein